MNAHYPDVPGAKVGGTSAEAAPTPSEAKHLRDRALQIFREPKWATGLTADECAQLMGLSILSIRPRVSELRRQGLIADSGTRRENTSGARACVWTATQPAAT